jgi:hypothetical protein
MSEPDNIVLAHLRELRAAMDARFDAVDARFDRIESRLDAMQRNGQQALRQFVGHRAMVERTIASFHLDIRAIERRVRPLEAAQS